MNISLLSHTAQIFLFNLKDQVIHSLTAQQRKVALIVFAFFSALAALGCVYRYWSKSRVDCLNDVSPKDSILPENLDDHLQPLKEQLLAQIKLATAIDNIQSAKFFIDITKNDNSTHKAESILKKEDLSCFDDKFLSQAIDVIFKNMHPFIEIKDFPAIDVTLEVILKAKSGEFIEVEVSKGSFGYSKIAPEDIKEYWAVIGESRKLVNDQREFI